jgi:uncharacterized protein (DUF3084 family)
MQSRIQEPEFEMSRVKDLKFEVEVLERDIQTRDRIIEAQDQDIKIARTQIGELEARSQENEVTLDRMLGELNEANKQRLV